MDVIEDIASAQQIRQLLHTEEVKEAFEDLDLSELSEDEIRRIIFEDQVSQNPDLYAEKLREERQEERREIARNLLDADSPEFCGSRYRRK